MSNTTLTGPITLTAGSGVLDNGTEIYSTGYGLIFGNAVTNFTNFGDIDAGITGVRLDANASFTNASSGIVTYNLAGGINGGQAGIYGSAGGNYIYNAGYIASPGAAIALEGAGTVRNAGGTIRGGNFGVNIVFGAGTVINAGTIYALNVGGHGGFAVNLASGLDNRVAVAPGAKFVGLVQGGGNGTLELESGSSAGTLTGFGFQYQGFSTIVVDAGATWHVDPADLLAGVTLAGSGTIVSGTVTNASYIFAWFSGSGGEFVNDAGGTVTGVGVEPLLSPPFQLDVDTYAVLVEALPGTVVNAGLIRSGYHAAIKMEAGGSVTNVGGGTITAPGGDVYISGGQGVVYNASYIGSVETRVWPNFNYASTSIILHDGGSVTNATGGTIISSGNDGQACGIEVLLGTGTVFNAGLIQSAGFTGIWLGSGGRVSNSASGVILGGGRALYAQGAASVYNAGLMTGLGGLGLTDGGSVTNALQGRITGTGPNSDGVYISHGISALVVNGADATIHGGEDGVDLDNAAADVENAGLISGGGRYSGVEEALGGSVSNAATGLIDGAAKGIFIRGGAGSVFNAGSIAGSTQYGITLAGGGSVTNVAGGVIGGGTGVGVEGGPGLTVVNAGTIAGSRAAVYFSPGAGNRLIVDPGAVFQGRVVGGNHGSILELASGAATGTLTGLGELIGYFPTIQVDPTASWVLDNLNFVEYGITLTDSGTLTNLAQIDGVSYLGPNGYLSNASSGQILNGLTGSAAGPGTVVNAGHISGFTSGIDLTGGGTVVDAGYIGSSNDAVSFAAGFTNLMVLDPSATIRGIVDGGNPIGASAISTLELASAASAGTITGIGSKFIDFADTRIDSGASWTLTAGNTFAAGANLTNNGTLTLWNTTLSNAVNVTNNGTIIIDPSSLTASSLTGTGTVVIDAGGTLSVLGSVAAGQIISFKGRGDTLQIDPTEFAGTIANFGVGDRLDFTGVTDAQSIGIADGDKFEILRQSHDPIFLKLGSTPASSGGYSVTSDGIVTAGGAAYAVYLGPGGVLTNPAGATIAGVYVSGGGTVSNAGSIVHAPDAVRFQSGYTNRLIDDPGGIFSGTVDGGNTLGGTSISTLELASGSSTGTLSGLGSQFVNFARITVDAGASWAMDTTDTVAAGQTLTIGGSLVNEGQILASVSLTPGAYLLNSLSGTIDPAAGVGVMVASGGGATVVNAGGIASTNYGIYLYGTYDHATNAFTGTIVGTEDGIVTQRSAVIDNAGTITGQTSTGIVLQDSGVVTNAASASIGGQVYGIEADSGAATVTNAGTITAEYAVLLFGSASTVSNAGSIVGSKGTGINLSSNGVVTNAATGTISGNVYLSGGGTVINAGYIGGSNYAVSFDYGYTNRLVVDPGAQFNGGATGGNTIGQDTAVSTLELSSGASGGTLSGLGTQFADFAQTTVDAGASWTLTGSNTLVAGATLTNSGSLALSDTTLAGAGVVLNGGIIDIDPSSVTVGSLYGTGTVEIGANSTLNVYGTVAAGETIVFSANTGVLSIDPTQFSGQIDGIQAGDTLDLTGIADATLAEIVNGNTLEVLRSGYPALDLTLDSGRDFSGGTFAVTADGVVTNTEEVPCFLRGTLIRTDRGEVRVQDLAVGDRVVTRSGAIRPIIWIGTGTTRVTPGKRCAATPVLVRKSALADNVPFDDLRITKGHSLFIDGVLIPVEFLVNNQTIRWDDHRQTVEFYHIELETHDVLLANGAASETYRDDGNRWLFRNANSGWDQPAKAPCAPVLTGGPTVDAIWRRLLDRAPVPETVALTADPDMHLLVDGVRVDATERFGSTHVFRLPSGPSAVRIISRAATPAECGLSRDTRRLGVAITRIMLRKAARYRVMEASDSALSDGFNAFETDLALRWTDGDAAVPESLFDGLDGVMALEVCLGGATRYPAFAEAVAHAGG